MSIYKGKFTTKNRTVKKGAEAVKKSVSTVKKGAETVKKGAFRLYLTVKKGVNAVKKGAETVKKGVFRLSKSSYTKGLQLSKSFKSFKSFVYINNNIKRVVCLK